MAWPALQNFKSIQRRQRTTRSQANQEPDTARQALGVAQKCLQSANQGSGTSHLVRAKTLSDSVDLPFPLPADRSEYLQPAMDANDAFFPALCHLGYRAHRKRFQTQPASRKHRRIVLQFLHAITRRDPRTINRAQCMHTFTPSLCLSRPGRERRARAPPCNLPSGAAPRPAELF